MKNDNIYINRFLFLQIYDMYCDTIAKHIYIYCIYKYKYTMMYIFWNFTNWCLKATTV